MDFIPVCFFSISFPSLYLDILILNPIDDLANYLTKQFKTFFEFVKSAGKMRGKVLVVAEDSTAAAMVIGFLMVIFYYSLSQT